MERAWAGSHMPRLGPAFFTTQMKSMLFAQFKLIKLPLHSCAHCHVLVLHWLKPFEYHGESHSGTSLDEIESLYG